MPEPACERLDDREVAALTAYAVAGTHAAAARMLGVSRPTYRGALLDAETRLGARSPVHAVALAVAAGVVEEGHLRRRTAPSWPPPGERRASALLDARRSRMARAHHAWVRKAAGQRRRYARLRREGQEAADAAAAIGISPGNVRRYERRVRREGLL